METENQTAESFYTTAINETEYWCADTLKKHGIKAAFGLYLFREGEATHVCSITPASWCEWMQNAFIFEDTATEAQREAAQDLEYENGGEGGQYVTPMRDRAKLDSRFIAGPVVVDHSDVDSDPEADADSFHSEIWEAAREGWNGSPDEPLILWDGVFDEWETGKQAARRA